MWTMYFALLCSAFLYFTPFPVVRWEEMRCNGGPKVAYCTSPLMTDEHEALLEWQMAGENRTKEKEQS
jgi:hypothetical protein